LHTEDNGNNWAQVYVTPEYLGNVYGFIFRGEDYGYAYGEGGILRTTNAGQFWDTAGTYRSSVIDLAIVNDSLVFALGGSSSGRIYYIERSTDRGKHWEIQLQVNYNLQTLYFLNDSTGWATGLLDYPSGFTVLRYRNNTWSTIR